MGPEGLQKESPVLPSIIDEHQTGGVAGRNVGDSTLLIHLLIQFYTVRGEEGYVLSVDSEKAHDNVIRERLWVVMNRFGFPQGLIDQVKFMYIGAKSKLVINGFLSDFISFDKGVRQGCPLSTILYTIFVEPLALCIRREVMVKGFKLPGGREIKMIQHSDDMNFLVVNRESIKIIIKIIEAYGKGCGNKINKSKSFIIKIAAARNITLESEFNGIKFIKNGEFGRVLGFQINGDVPKYVEKNWELVRGGISKVLNRWKGETLSLAGKVLIINTLVIPKIIYKMGTLELNALERGKIEDLISDFIWPYRNKEKPINILCWPQVRGGLGLVSLRVKSIVLKLDRVKQYLNREEGEWEWNALHLLMRFHMDLTYRINIDSNLPFSRYGADDQYTAGRVFCGINFYQEMINCIRMLKSFETESRKIPQMDKQWVGGVVLDKFYREERGKRENWVLWDEWGWSKLNETKMWFQVFHPYLDPKIKAFGWRVVHGILQVKSRISNGAHKMFDDGMCLCCSKIGRFEIETIEHLLLDCGVAKIVWNKINTALFKANLQEIELSPEVIIARRGLGAETNYIAAEVAWALWVARINEEKDGTKKTWKGVISSFKFRLNLRRYVDLTLKKGAKWSKLECFLRNLGVT